MTTGGDGGKRRAGALIRLGVSALVLLIVFQFVPAGELFSRMRTVSPALWAAVFAVFLAGHAIAAAKWRWMIGGAVGYPRALKAHFAGLAANLMLPGVAGGDIVRAGMVMKGSQRKTALAVGSLADRLIDTAALIVVAEIGALWLGARAGVDPLGLGLVAAMTIAAAAIGVFFMKPIATLVRAHKPAGKFGAIAGDIADAVEEMSMRRATLIGCALLSITIQLIFALMNGLIAQNIGAGTTLAAWVFAWPLAKLISTLPISFGGLGVREASLAGIMTPLGYPAAGVVAASLVWQAILFAAGAVGALAQTAGVRESRVAEARHG